MTEIDEGHSSWLILIKICLSEETVGEGASSGFIDESDTIDASNLTCIKISLSFAVACIGRYRNDDIFTSETCLLKVDLDTL